MESVQRAIEELNQDGADGLRVVIGIAAEKVERMSRILAAPENEHLPPELVRNSAPASGTIGARSTTALTHSATCRTTLSKEQRC